MVYYICTHMLIDFYSSIYKVTTHGHTYDNVYHYTVNATEQFHLIHSMYFYTDSGLFVYFMHFSLQDFRRNSN